MSESALDRASGGAVFPTSPAVSALKLELKIDDLAATSVKLPIAKPGN